MLETLDIHDYALIEDAHIEFVKGFTAITGETGAGKSIMLSAVSLLLGSKGDVSSIRVGCESASVCGLFVLEQQSSVNQLLQSLNLPAEDDQLIVRRVLKSNGRTLSYINNTPVNRSDLLQITSHLVDISAQHAHQSLLKEEKQLQLVDSYADDGKELSAYQACFTEHSRLVAEREEKIRLMAEGKKEEDYLGFALQEIDRIAPKEGEDEQLADAIHRSSQFENIHDNLQQTVELLRSYEGGGILSELGQGSDCLEKAAGHDSGLSSYATRLSSVQIECEDIYESLRDYLTHMTYSQEELDDMQSRLAQLQRLMRKYGPTLSQVLSFRDETRSKVDSLTSGETDLADLDKRIASSTSACAEAGRKLSEKRKRGSLALGKEIVSVLHGLGMPHAVLSIQLEPCGMYDKGSERVSFMFCANPGLEIRPLAEIASGGELSRVMLAIKATLREKDPVATLWFDEVDAGIGGVVASNVAKELKHLSLSSQILAITHLASIASKADSQLVVHKEVRDSMSYSLVVPVTGEARIKEIARMLSGDSNSKVSLEHAKELLD
jgi:DNA repair protein RecN (Recombination protein N)